jgi:hypothetical protein
MAIYPGKLKVKMVKLPLSMPRKQIEGAAEVQFPSFLTLRLAGGEVSMSCHSCFTVVKELL